LRLGKGKPRIMLLGPGSGQDNIELYSYLRAQGIFPGIGVFGLTKSLSKDVANVRKDFSFNVPLELVDPKIQSITNL